MNNRNNNRFKVKCNVQFKNAKLQPSDTVKYLIYNLPSEDGIQEKRFPSVAASRMKNLDHIKREKFVDDMIETINHFLAKWQGATIHVIIAGNLNKEVIGKWNEIKKHFNGNERLHFVDSCSS